MFHHTILTQLKKPLAGHSPLMTKKMRDNIGIIGVGKLGLVYALMFEQNDPHCHVWASSYKQEYVDDLQKKITDSVEPGVADMLAKSERITFTTDNHDVIRNCDIIYVMVATPSLAAGNYDVSAVEAVIQDFLNHGNSVAHKILVVGSTVNPGDCARFQATLKPSGVSVVYSPTFAAQGSVVHDVANPIEIAFGTTDEGIATKCEQAFAAIIPEGTPIYHMHPTTVEIMKLIGNCYITTRINFYNLMGQLLTSSGLSNEIDKANQYLCDLGIRKNNLKFGFGYGGPCYPRDNKSLEHFARSVGVNHRLAEINDVVNHEHSTWLAQHFLSDNQDDLPFYFAYISYKPGVKMFEESQQLMVATKILEFGKKVIIEPTVFLDPAVIDSLNQRFPGQVQILSKTVFDKHNIEVYNIKF